MTTADKSVVLKKGEGTALWFMGSLIELKATGDDTDGALTAFEMTIGPSSLGAPPHKHDFGEAVYVLEGTLTYHIGDRTVEASAGSFLIFPKGTMEWFENTADSPARALAIYPRAGMENFFIETSQPAESRSLPPPPPAPTPAEFEKLAAAAKRQGTELFPPPHD